VDSAGSRIGIKPLRRSRISQFAQPLGRLPEDRLFRVASQDLDQKGTLWRLLEVTTQRLARPMVADCFFVLIMAEGANR
jgi:hypothetical protein